jgi:hypothetical protein
MGDRGKCLFKYASIRWLHAIYGSAPITCPLEIGTTMIKFSQEIEHMKCRMNRAVHVRRWGRAGVKFPWLTRLYAIIT